MEILRRQHPDHLELLFEGRLDGYWAQHLSTSAAEIMREGAHAVRLNLSKTTYISSAGIGVLVEIYKQFAAVNGSFAVTELSRQVQHVLDMVGLGPMLTGAKPSAAAPIREPIVERREIAGASFEFHTLDASAALTCHIVGRPDPLARGAFSAADCHSVALTANRVFLGLGAFGSEGFGEILAVAGAAACQPTDGPNFPDYMMSSGNFIPDLSALYGLYCDGPFSKLVRFEGTEPIPLSRVVEACLEGAPAAGMVLLAESAGLLGATLKRSPAGANTPLFAYPEIRSWLSFCPERSHAHALALIAGIATTAAPELALQPLVRPISRFSNVHGHFHAAAFGYRPLQKGKLELKPTITSLFEAGGLTAVLHLLADDRDPGAGETELNRGACWVAPIRGVRPWEPGR